MSYIFKRNKRKIEPKARWMFLLLIIVFIGGIGYSIVSTAEEQLRLWIWLMLINGGAIGMGIWLGLVKRCFDGKN